MSIAPGMSASVRRVISIVILEEDEEEDFVDLDFS